MESVCVREVVVLVKVADEKCERRRKVRGEKSRSAPIPKRRSATAHASSCVNAAACASFMRHMIQHMH